MDAIYTHTYASGKTFTRCLKCTLVVDKDGNPDPEYYLAAKYLKIMAIPKQDRCDHKRVLSRENDPVVKDLLLKMASVNIQNPEYTAIKRILEYGLGSPTTKVFKDSLSWRQYLLVKLIEECAEVQQRATKALTFGMYESQSAGPSLNDSPEAKLNNNERLAQEFDDLIAVSEMLNEHINVPLSTTNTRAKELKKEKIKKYMEYSRKVGTLA